MTAAPSSSGTPDSVVVVGAGLAGLAAARELRARGCEVTVLERSSEPGGRSAGQHVEGFSIERTLSVIRGSDHRLLSWVREQAADTLLPLRPVQVAQLSGASVEPIDPRTPWGIGRIAGVRRREAMRLIRLPRLMRRYRASLDPEAPEKAADWDYRSVADFGRLYFGESVVQSWMGPALSSYGNVEELSRVAFLLDWVASEEGHAGTFLLQAGLQRAAQAAAESLGVRFGVEVDLVEAQASGVLRLSAGSERFEADAVVVTSSPSNARAIADPLLTLAERDVLEGFVAAPEIVLSVALDRELTGIPQYIRVPCRERSTIKSMLLDPGGPGLRAPMGAGLATLSASDDFCRTHAGAADDVLEKALIAEFERIHPRAAGRARFARVARREQAVPQMLVGVCRSLRRFDRVQQDLRAQGRRLYFAGDYLIGPRPENAVASGMRAARALLQR